MTSAISLLEGQVAAVTEQKNWDRKKVTIGLSAIMFVVGLFYTISQAAFNIKGVWVDFTNGVQFPVMGDFMEFMTDRLLIPINALTACILAGWIWGAKHGIAEVEQNGKFPFKLGAAWSASVKIIAPVGIGIIIIFGLLLGKAIS
jgi:NSS family neurotransmitter:Na+ symporter